MVFFRVRRRPRKFGNAILAAASICALSAAHGVFAAPLPSGPHHIDVAGTRLEISAVDADIFHIMAYPADQPHPADSPFVVETRAAGGVYRQTTDGGFSLQTAQRTLRIGRDGVFTVTAPGNTTPIRSGWIRTVDNGITLSIAHGANQRLYGAGNADMNRSGDLTHPSGEMVIKNGATRIPFLWSTGGYGVLIANNLSGASWSDKNGVLAWNVPAPYADIYLIVDNGGYGILNGYSRLTGRAPIPPRWTFGYMLSRWGYRDAADIQDKWRQFRDRKIPVDAFIYDYDWFDDDWKFNPGKFPDGSLSLMKSMGLHFVGIRKPRVNGANLEFAIKQGWITKTPFSTDMPGTLSVTNTRGQDSVTIRKPRGSDINMDFATKDGWANKMPFGTDLRFDLPEARSWWWSHQAPLMKAGVDGWWNDEAEQTYDEFFQMASLQWEGQRALNSRRVWTLNRAFAPGMQRFGAAVWSGDITSSWTTLQNQPGTLLNFSLAGMPYVGQDTGGFFGPPEPELYARWIEEAVYTPIMRSHGMLDEPRWPWAFGDEALDAIKRSIELRYRMIPYIYTCAATNCFTGAPIMRPLVLEYPQDPNTFNLEDEWMLGNQLLAAPILSKGGSRSVYLPKGKWYDFNTNKAIDGGQTISIENAPLATLPAYLRAGSILPLGPVMQYTGQMPVDPLEVRVYPGADGSFDLYEDAGDDYSYEQGHSTTIPFRWDDKRYTLTIAARKGSFPGMLRTRHMNVVTPDGRSRSIVYGGSAVSVRL